MTSTATAPSSAGWGSAASDRATTQDLTRPGSRVIRPQNPEFNHPVRPRRPPSSRGSDQSGDERRARPRTSQLEDSVAIKVEAPIGGQTFSLEAGKLAEQADGAVLVRYGDTVVLATAVAKEPREGLDFFPMPTDYEERMYAAGKIPGGF